MVNGGGFWNRAAILPSENPVASGLQSDDIAGLEFPIPGRVDLDHGRALAGRQGDFRALDRAERPDTPYRALKRTAASRADLHVMATDEQFRCAGSRTVRRDIERLAAEPHAAVADIHRQHNRLADEAVHESGGGMVIDLTRRADLL